MASTATHSHTEDLGEKVPIFAFAAVVLAGLVGTAFAMGWLLGRILL